MKIAAFRFPLLMFLGKSYLSYHAQLGRPKNAGIPEQSLTGGTRVAHTTGENPGLTHAQEGHYFYAINRVYRGLSQGQCSVRSQKTSHRSHKRIFQDLTFKKRHLTICCPPPPTGLAQLQDKIVTRFALTIYRFSVGVFPKKQFSPFTTLPLVRKKGDIKLLSKVNDGVQGLKKINQISQNHIQHFRAALILKHQNHKYQ